jgi:transcriptional regulator with XRE-family HTH domain
MGTKGQFMPHVLGARQHWQEAPCCSTFGLWLRQQRHALGLSQTQFALECHLGQSRVGDYERGRHHPTRGCAKNIADRLELPLSEVEAKVAESLAYWREHGEIGMIRLIASQPKVLPPGNHSQERFDKRRKNFEHLEGELTVNTKIHMPMQYHERLMRIAANKDTSISALGVEAIELLLEVGHWKDWEY